MFTSINEIVQLSRDNGYTFFNKNRQEEHKTRVLPTIYGGMYFITEQLHNGKKFYSIYKALKDGACDVVRGEIFISKRSAERYLKIAILPNIIEYEEDSYELR